MDEQEPSNVSLREPRSTIARKPLPSPGPPSSGPERGFESLLPEEGYSRHQLATDDDIDAASPGESRNASIARTRLESVFGYAWFLEIASCVFSLVALAAIVITLARYQGQPLPQWPQSISINSLVSIFTTVLKAAILMPVAEGISQQKWHWFRQSRTLMDLEHFDAASRGPWGSILLLFKASNKLVVLCGAFITIAALAIDPFSQQIIHYYSCMELVPGVVASIPRTNNYSQSGAHVSAGLNVLDGATAAAIYQGLLNPAVNASSIINPTCLTGNCTFPADDGASFQSLGMCNSCQDITSDVVISGINENWNYSLPSGANVNSRDQTVMSTAIVSNSLDALLTFDALMISNYQTTLVNPPFAFQCEVFPCVNTYAANITSSVLDEVILSTARVHDTGGDLDFNLATNKTLRNGIWQDCQPSNEPSETNQVRYPLSTEGNAPAYLYYPADCIWSYSQNSVFAIQPTLSGFFDAAKNNTLGSDTGTLEGANGPAWLIDLGVGGIANLSTVTIFMDGLTDSLTANVREGGDTPHTSYALGATYGEQTCISAQWAWLSLPASLLLLAVVFLTVTIVQTSATARSQHDGPWKSSSLALIYHGFIERAGTQASYKPPLNGRGEMERAAKRTRAQLILDGDGSWGFVEKKG